MVQHGFRLFIEVVSHLTSVDRIIQYTNLPKEHPLYSPTPLPQHWPKRGLIKLKRVSMRYDENHPYVLKVGTFIFTILQNNFTELEREKSFYFKLGLK